MARTQLGAAYLWGGTAPSTGFDCAGLVWWVYAEAGMELGTRWIPALAAANPLGDLDEPLPGDLVFFANTYKPGLSHVGIYVGNNRMVHAAGYQWGVVESDLSGWYYRAHYAGASRPWSLD